MQCICSTGIRVSELKYITIESLGCGKTEINNKGKIRVILLPSKLCKALKSYAKKQKIKSGPVFVSKNGPPVPCCLNNPVERKGILWYNVHDGDTV